MLNIDQLQAKFLSILPRIRTHARIYFRHVRCSCRKADFISETIAMCWKWFVRLAERGKDACQFPLTLATYAAKAVKNGRRVCRQLKAKDVLSERAQQRHDFSVGGLPHSTATNHENLYGNPHGQRQLDAFEERLQDNTITPIPDQAAFRIDWPAWLKTRCKRDRHMIREMAKGERTQDLAKRFQLSQARISQLRREFHEDWDRFTADPIDA
jgi:hypothetical protein